MAEQPSTGTFQNVYKFNGKELDTESGLYYYEARYYDPRSSVWLSVDPMMEKYPGWSVYNFCIGNPIILVDTKGEDLIIWYKSNKKLVSFAFNGQNGSAAPNDKFVQSVITAYNYNTTRGGGNRMKEAATNHSVMIDVVEHFESRGAPESIRNLVFWNPYGGLLTDEGDILSPATIFEHEIDHRLHKVQVGEYKHNKDLFTKSENGFDSIEEERVITGSELTTGTANKEFKKSIGRKSHGGVTVIVDGPTSTRANRQQSIKYWKQLDYDSPHGINIKIQISKIEKWIL